MIRCSELPASIPSSGKGRRTGHSVRKRSCLGDGASIKQPRTLRCGELLGWHTIPMRQERGTPQPHGNERCCARGPSRPHPGRLFIWLLVCLLHRILDNKQAGVCFCEFYELLEQIIKSEEGLVGTPVYSWSVRSMSDNLGLGTGI